MSRVRTRALLHMQQILATSAAAAACHHGDKKTVDAGADAVAFGPPTVDAAGAPVLATVDAGDNVVVGPRDHGYAVVDPMPRPAHCPDLAAHIRGTAARSGENVVLKMTNAGGRSGFKYTTTPPTLYSGTLVKHAIEGGTAVVTFKPAKGTTSTSVSLKGNCTNGPVTITAEILTAGDSFNVYVSEF